jgi:hypothetical protein
MNTPFGSKRPGNCDRGDDVDCSDLITLFDCHDPGIHLETGVSNLICSYERIKSKLQSCDYLSDKYLLSLDV